MFIQEFCMRFPRQTDQKFPNLDIFRSSVNPRIRLKSFSVPVDLVTGLIKKQTCTHMNLPMPLSREHKMSGTSPSSSPPSMPERKAAVFGGRRKHITIFKQKAAMCVSNPNLEDQEIVFVRSRTNDQLGMRDPVGVTQTFLPPV
ncbi:hypothetical protein CSKR_203759 [Clonorchis sinensis]|uniref:Uncharacterized protein n=1 Tax=Clonorchis sinensis TaxID=79923 RepID=A0A8T1N0U2_CLOSI|nr:hypothetical protein CSKR_203759 [Clonorchis sinensis]